MQKVCPCFIIGYRAGPQCNVTPLSCKNKTKQKQIPFAADQLGSRQAIQTSDTTEDATDALNQSEEQSEQPEQEQEKEEDQRKRKQCKGDRKIRTKLNNADKLLEDVGPLSLSVLH